MKLLSVPGVLITALIFLSSIVQTFSQPVIISGGSENDIIGRVARMPDDKLMAVIERNPDWNSGDLYVSFSDDDGETWGTLRPVIVKDGNQSTFSVVLSIDDSVRIYYASDETGSYQIYGVSSLNGITWSEAVLLNLGWLSSQSIYDPCVIVENDGSMTMTYVRLGGGIYIAHCDEVNVWDTDKTLIQNSAYRGRICRQTNGEYLAAYHRNIGSSQYEVFVRTSFDRINWTDEIRLTFNGNSHDPYCNITPDGSYIVYYAGYYGIAYNLYRRISSDGITWLPEEQITMDNTNNTQSAFFIEGDILYLVWTHAIDYDTDNDIYFQKFDYIPVHTEEVKEEELCKVYKVDAATVAIDFGGIRDDDILMQLFDISGRVVRRIDLSLTCNHQSYRIPVAGLEGVFILSVTGRHIIYSTKIVM